MVSYSIRMMAVKDIELMVANERLQRDANEESCCPVMVRLALPPCLNDGWPSSLSFYSIMCGVASMCHILNSFNFFAHNNYDAR